MFLTRTIQAVNVTAMFLMLSLIFTNRVFAATDTDDDGVNDSSDNCIQVQNPLQRDTDSDGYGNFCDPDFDNNLIVGAADLAYFKQKFFSTDPDADLNGDGGVNAADLAILKVFFFKPPGPSYIDTTTTETGILLDSPVSGVNYNTATQSGVTDAQGNYSYLPGETVTFSIGDIDFPPVIADSVVTPIDMVGKTDLTDLSLINILRLIQSLDVDGDPSNGIEISSDAHDAATGLTVDFQSPTFDTDVANLVANSGSITTTLIDQTTAINNFIETIKTLPVDWESYYNYADNRQWNYTVDLSWISTLYEYTIFGTANGEDVYIHGWSPNWDPNYVDYFLRDFSNGPIFIGYNDGSGDTFFSTPLPGCTTLYESCTWLPYGFDLTWYNELDTVTVPAGTFNDCIKTTQTDNTVTPSEVGISWRCKDVGMVKAEKVGFTQELFSITTYIPPSRISDITFADNTLKMCVEATGATWTYEITELYCSNLGISDISGIENLTEISKLYLDYNNISDIAPLAFLSHLKDVNLWGNAVSDISPLASLGGLRSIALQENNISILPNMDSLVNLNALDLSNNFVTDISPLSSLVNLTILNLMWNNVSDINALTSLTKLTSLQLHYNSISDISPLAPLTSLEYFWVSGDITDISPVASFTKLSDLAIISTAVISDVSPIASLTNLTSLRLATNHAFDLSVLTPLSKLTFLYIPSSNISDIAPIASLTSLTELNLIFNSITDITAIASLTNLTRLNLEENQISDVSPLASLVNVDYLFLNNNNITSGVSSLVSLINAIRIDLSGNTSISCAELSTLVSALGSVVIQPASCI